MMSDPEILVLDEPTSGLDPNQIAEIRTIIREIGREKTILFSTHILSEAEATCDRIVIIDGGQVVADGTAESLRASTADENLIYLGLLEAEYEDVRRTVSGLPGVRDVQLLTNTEADAPQTTVRVQLVCDRDLRPEIYRAIKQESWIVIEFTRERRSLETVFRSLTHAGESVKEM